MRKKPDKKIVEEINKLFEEAAKNARLNPLLSKKYIAKARKIAKHENFSLRNYRRKFCRNCNAYFVPGLNCQIRIIKGRITIKCLDCGSCRRFKIH